MRSWTAWTSIGIKHHQTSSNVIKHHQTISGAFFLQNVQVVLWTSSTLLPQWKQQRWPLLCSSATLAHHARSGGTTTVFWCQPCPKHGILPFQVARNHPTFYPQKMTKTCRMQMVKTFQSQSNVRVCLGKVPGEMFWAKLFDTWEALQNSFGWSSSGPTHRFIMVHQNKRAVGSDR